MYQLYQIYAIYSWVIQQTKSTQMPIWLITIRPHDIEVESSLKKFLFINQEQISPGFLRQIIIETSYKTRQRSIHQWQIKDFFPLSMFFHVGPKYVGLRQMKDARIQIFKKGFHRPYGIRQWKSDTFVLTWNNQNYANIPILRLKSVFGKTVFFFLNRKYLKKVLSWGNCLERESA